MKLATASARCACCHSNERRKAHAQQHLDSHPLSPGYLLRYDNIHFKLPNDISLELAIKLVRITRFSSRSWRIRGGVVSEAGENIWGGEGFLGGECIRGEKGVRG